MKSKLKKEKIDNKYFLFGVLNAFANRLQSVGNTFFEEMSWKQWFVLLGISLFENPPTINQVAQVIGSSHQNVKQILLKLEKAGFVELYTDETDRRKIRMKTTDKKMEFDKKYSKESAEFMKDLYKGLDNDNIDITIKTLLAMEQNLMNIKR